MNAYYWKRYDWYWNNWTANSVMCNKLARADTALKFGKLPR